MLEKTDLTAKYRDVTVTTTLYIFENDNYAIVGSGLDTTIEPNTRYDSDIQLLCFDEVIQHIIAMGIISLHRICRKNTALFS